MNEELLKRIDLLAEKLSTTGEHLYGVLVTQAYIQATYSVITLALLVLVTALSVFANKKVAKYYKENDYDMDVIHILSGGLWFVYIGIGVAIVSSNIMMILTCLANPEYFALTKILGN